MHEKYKKKNQLVLVRCQYNQVSENIIYLGEWCHSYPKSEIEKGKEVTLPYHWDDREKLYHDYLYLQELNDRLISELTPVLNNLHSVDESERYWMLVMGYWVNLYTAVLFDRWSTIKQLLSRYDLDDLEITGEITREMQSETMWAFNHDVKEDWWNESIFLMVLEHYAKRSLATDRVNESKRKKVIKRRSINIRHTMKMLLNKLSSFIGRDDEVMMINTYISKELQSGLYERFGMFPRYWFDCSDLVLESNAEMRSWSMNVPEHSTVFERLVRELMPTMLPKTLVEGYKGIHREIDRHNWPKSPKVIVTSVKHYTSEIFVCWAARARENGARLVLGEHGGYGVGKFNGAVSFQMKVADRFLSTGWLEKTVPTSPIGNFRTADRKQSCQSDGKLLMVTVAMPRYSFDVRSMVTSGQMVDYFSDQFAFANHLPVHIRSELVVRLFPSDHGWNQAQRWKDHVPDVNFDDASQPMWKMFENCRLFIATYNATTHIDALALNVPIVIFWNPNHWEIKPEAESYFSELEKVRVFHSTPASAADHVERIWGDVASWWYSDAVQNAISSFCDQYSANPPDMLDRLESAIREEMEVAEHNMSRHSH